MILILNKVWSSYNFEGYYLDNSRPWFFYPGNREKNA